MSSIRTSIATAVAVVALPGAAVAASVLVDHGRGPTYTHDAAYADITTQVHAWTRGETTTVRLMVERLPPGRTFGAHVHTGTCGTDPTTSGGHYQHAGATGPLAEREVWLDVTSDARGRGVATATVPWSFVPGAAGSVVIHALPTDPTTGAAGARLACTSVAFGDHPGH
ncbi:superoxide dismutase [Nocardioides sp. S5]|uniref:superoxide dismutase family protein n=1 Tax=Nocardioides sp. S5 TaxID=2017486 RepID=UPI001A90BE48|nr:superoxide dismutase family protein [Nocardioides sp. S5]QSR30952.1 superoxide dismutase [Nocardioides sp. S5]